MGLEVDQKVKVLLIKNIKELGEIFILILIAILKVCRDLRKASPRPSKSATDKKPNPSL